MKTTILTALLLVSSLSAFAQEKTVKCESQVSVDVVRGSLTLPEKSPIGEIDGVSQKRDGHLRTVVAPSRDLEGRVKTCKDGLFVVMTDRTELEQGSRVGAIPMIISFSCYDLEPKAFCK